MLKEIEGGISLLSRDGSDPILDEDESQLKEMVFEYYARWEDELDPAVGEVQLLAGPIVAGLADRTSWAIMELIGFMEARQAFNFFTPYFNQTRTLIDKTRNAMRQELGLPDPITTFPMPKDWPWLPEGSTEKDE